MNVALTEEIIKAVGPVKLKPFGVDPERDRWSSSTSVSLKHYNNAQVKHLASLITPLDGRLKGVASAKRDLQCWIDAATLGAANVKCKTTKHFAALSHEFIQKLDGHLLYKKDDDRDVWQPYYVGQITFKEKQVSRDDVIPARTVLDLYYMELGQRKDFSIEFNDWHVKGFTVPEVLSAKNGLITETIELKAEHAAHLKRYVEFHDKIGKQFFATGVGTTNLDGNSDGENSHWYQHQTLQLERDGEPSRVVIDVRFEGNERQGKDDPFDVDYWRGKSYLDADNNDDPDTVEPGQEEDSAEPTPPPTIPVFPIVPTFDLRRHLRMRIHIANLAEYIYDPKLGDKLILPNDNRALVDMLLSHSGGFRDIIGKKGGGAVILCAGRPGTGKTLTAEVYSEVVSRPLYTVQCSQLGTDEVELETELLKVFSRAQRWNAILLLDEADVYVAKRGSDLQQNAIVGVFLRVLEYYNGVMFMTTNRADLVDDAVLSRCIARLTYDVPTIEDQKKIWAVLSAMNGAKLPDHIIDQIVTEHPRCTGRDIKNLLKLGSMVAKAYNTQLEPKVITFVKRFKPTIDEV